MSLPPLGRSDHNIVQLIPRYRPLVQREPTVTRTIKEWSDDAVDINELTESVCGYTDFCVECTIPQKTVKMFPNNKPWITKRIKGIINSKKLAFLKNDKEEYRSVQKELKEEIRKEKEQYKNKIESHFTYNNMRRVWSGMKLMSRYVNGNTQKIASVNTAGEINELIQFFNRFDCHNSSQKHMQIHDILNRASDEEGDFQRLNTNEDEVRRAFQHVNPNKATGPDNCTTNT